MKAEVIDYKKIYKKAALNKWWVFKSSNNTDNECSWWDLYEYVLQNFNLTNKVVLDIWCAEWLKFMNLSPYFLYWVWIDIEPKMIQLAEENKNNSKVFNINFLSEDFDNLKFPDNFFDLITCRHSPFNLAKVHKLLKKGGVFITQQVWERDKQNIKDTFWRWQSYWIPTDTYLNRIIKQWEQIGFNDVKFEKSNLNYYFNWKDHLIDFLKLTPVIPDFNYSKEKLIVDSFIKNYKDEKWIVSNSDRFMLKLIK